MEKLDLELSKAQQLLLMTDGSVTTLLEVITGKPVVVTTLLQQVVEADAERASALDVEEGDNINYRVVVLKNDDNHQPLIYAESYTPIARLKKEFRHDLMKADIPIGRIMNQRKIESRREIRRIEIVCNEEVSELFGVAQNVPLLSRTYDIISKPINLAAAQSPTRLFNTSDHCYEQQA